MLPCPFMRQVALVLCMLSAVRSDAAVPTKILGFDDQSCRAWSASKTDADQRAIYVAWVRGVVTGHNYANPSQQVSSVSSATVEQFVTRYCNEKPLGQFSDAAFRLTDQFSGRNAAITK